MAGYDLHSSYTEEWQGNKLIHRTGTGVTYICSAKHFGSTSSEAVWRVIKVDESDPNNVEVTAADGDDKFDNIADDYLSLSYS